MIALELTGKYYTLYLEGQREEAILGSSLGFAIGEGRFRYSGRGVITRTIGERIRETFLFHTEEANPERFDALTLLLPHGTGDQAGWSIEEIQKAVEDGPPQALIDAYIAKALDDIEAWKAAELTAKQASHRVLTPTIALCRPSRALIELGLGKKMSPAHAWDE